MDVAIAEWLASPDGAAAVRVASGALAATADPLAAAGALRRAHPGLGPDVAAAAVAQADLARHRKAPSGWLLTRDGLEQGTDPRVAASRARAIAASGARSVIDATASLGYDTAALVAEGLQVTAFERDPATAILLAANVPGAHVVVADATQALTGLTADAVLVDPARRVAGHRTADGARARSERDPERWSPPLSWALGLPDAMGCLVVVKGPPGLAVPPGWHGMWTSVDRTLVELALWSRPIASGAGRAIVIDDAGTHRLDVNADATAPIAAAEPGQWLVEPDAAVVAAAGVDTLAVDLGASRLDPESPWLVRSSPRTTPFARAWHVLDELPTATRELRAALRARGIDNPTVKTVGAGIDAARVRRDLRAAPGSEGTIALVRIDGRLRAYLLETVAR